MPRLTQKQRLFVEAYCGAARGNATGSARLAGYKGNDNTLSSVGDQNLRKPAIKAAIEAFNAKVTERAEVTAEQVIRELALIGLSDVNDYSVDVAGSLSIENEKPSDATRAVSSVRRRIHIDTKGCTTVDVELKLWDKPAALKMLGERFKLFTKKHEHTGEDGKPLAAPTQVVILPAKDK